MKSIHDYRYQQLIRKMVVEREQRDVTQLQLAQTLDKPQSYVAKVENFDRRLDVVELADWLRALGVNPQAFTNEFEWFADGADENT
jgi:transcriptional regulator with XRE-family HTH domain